MEDLVPRSCRDSEQIRGILRTLWLMKFLKQEQLLKAYGEEHGATRDGASNDQPVMSTFTLPIRPRDMEMKL